MTKMNIVSKKLRLILLKEIIFMDIYLVSPFSLVPVFIQNFTLPKRMTAGTQFPSA